MKHHRNNTRANVSGHRTSNAVAGEAPAADATEASTGVDQLAAQPVAEFLPSGRSLYVLGRGPTPSLELPAFASVASTLRSLA